MVKSSAMRMLLMVVVVAAGFSTLGCAKKRVQVANTPEGNSCRRECMQVYQSCMGARGGGKYVCRNQENECLRTCPGAVY